MRINSKRPTGLYMLALLSIPVAAGLSAQEQGAAAGVDPITVVGTIPADLTGFAEGPDVEGFIFSRNHEKMQVRSADGTNTVVGISAGTEIRSRKGLFGLDRTELGADSLLNGLPVTVRTVQWGGGLVARQIRFKGNDLKTATMIRSGTEQQFDEHGAAIDENTAAADALRGRMGDIDKYNIKGTTNVYFDTGKWKLSTGGKVELCNAAAEAETMNNALLLVVGYTDSVGSQDFNQELSEKRAGRVVNYLQQACSWKPYRMLTPTGMAESDPMASNDTEEGKAQNRRVSVNILVSKGLDGL